LRDAIAVNMVTMIGSAIFITIPLVLAAMGGPQAFLGWIAGMLFSLADAWYGLNWALRCRMPAAPTFIWREHSERRGADCLVSSSCGGR
jgi:hypothetical protein